MDKKILLASFIFPERLDWFLNYLDKKFSIPQNKVFGYKNIDDETKIIVTYKLTMNNGEKIDLKSNFPNAIIIHKNGDALYTINALNKLIESSVESGIGNIDYKSHKIDWSTYQNKLILTDKQKLSILNIVRVF
jgi:hypothetical protein